MKFKCNISGCVYTFTSELDIKSMRASLDYTLVEEVPEPVEVVPASVLDQPATIVVVTPKPAAPNKPAPAAAVASKAV